MANTKTFNRQQAEYIKTVYPLLYKTMMRAEAEGFVVGFVTIVYNNKGNRIIQYKLHTKHEKDGWQDWTNEEMKGYLSRMAFLKKEMKPKKYTISVVRIGYGFADIEVTAKSQQQAEEMALDKAGDYEFSEKDAEYKIAD
jgi:hypothetical protein